jgi:peptidoglycan/xylan/chitin deacetylase (PgdA/CDA1 family)
MRPAIVAFGAAAAAWSIPAPAPHAPPLAAALGVPLRLEGAHGVALTFDDGPHPQGTPAVLDALARAGATATFFVVGERVAREPALAREILAAGHALALHGQRHRCQLLLTPRALADDLAAVAATVQDATGSAPALYRPPYGVFSAAGLALVRHRGWRTLLWSRWGRDWGARARPPVIAARATRALRAGEVLLLHDDDTYSSEGSWRRTAAALPAILDAVHAAGLHTVTA